MLILKSVRDAERFVNRQKSAGGDVRWDNYDLVFFKPRPKAIYSRHGVFRNGEYGYEERVPVASDGTWSVDYKNVKRVRRN